MIKQKIHIEQVEPTLGSSFTIRKFNRQFSQRRSQWHAHPEFELVYISNGNGNRHISNSLTSYQDGDLIFIGPNLPHLGFSDKVREDHTEVVIQIPEHFLKSFIINLPEFDDIATLLERTRNAISFRGSFKHEIGREMIEMVEMDPLFRLNKLLEILQRLAISNSYISLNAELMDLNVESVDGDRLRQISSFVRTHYKKPLLVADIASEVGMTVPAFCRFFKKVTNKTFNQFLNEYRIGHARRMIRKSSFTLSAISQECGFLNISNFNKQFKRISGETPSQFRKRHIQLIST